MKFLRNLLAAILGSFIAFGIILCMGFLFLFLAGSEEKSIAIPRTSVLKISLQEPLKDYGGKYNFTDLQYHFENYDGLNHILHAIRFAATDDKIKGISIDNTFLPAGMAQLKAIRDALEDFKASGKFVYAYGDFYMQKDYYLASVADSVFLNPTGGLDFRGLASEVLFFKDFQDKTGIKMEVIRHGKYKSAVEPFIANEMSEANREQISGLLHSLWSNVVTDISESRNLSTDTLQHIAETLAARMPEGAVKTRLIDRTMYYDEYETLLKYLLHTDDDEEIHYIKVRDYAEYADIRTRRAGKDRIAVVYAQGTIIYGEGNDELVGQGIITKALKEARENPRVKAIVLRVNSPGGSALASDIIWREIERTQTVKPVIVSMGDLAASGGYYIACGAEKIFAEPSTITGSIGVFGMLPNVKGLTDKLGINAEHVTTHTHALGYSVFEPMSEDFRNFAAEGVDEIYRTFLERVASGRNMTVEAVDRIAQGKIWSGTEARDIGLVDETGGLDEAIAYAAATAGTENYTVESYPVYETSVTELAGRIFGFPITANKESLLKSEIGEEAYRLFKKIQELTRQKGIQARLPFEIDIR